MQAQKSEIDGWISKNEQNHIFIEKQNPWFKWASDLID